MFHRVGRALIKPVYAQKLSRCACSRCVVEGARSYGATLCRCGRVGDRLRAALRWWEVVLRQSISELRPWQPISTPPCHLFVDAASSPAQCGAVAFIDGRVFYTCARPNAAVWKQFAARQDRQITGLEILACAIALSTFQQEIAGRVVCLYSDNTGALSVGWVLGMLSLVLCPQVQNTPLQRAAHAHGITTSWFMPYGCKLSCSTSTCGSFAYPRKTTWQTCRPVPSFSSSWTWEACGAIPPLLIFILVALVTTRSPARLSDRRRCALHHYSSGSSLFSHAAQLQER